MEGFTVDMYAGGDALSGIQEVTRAQTTLRTGSTGWALHVKAGQSQWSSGQGGDDLFYFDNIQLCKVTGNLITSVRLWYKYISSLNSIMVLMVNDRENVNSDPVSVIADGEWHQIIIPTLSSFMGGSEVRISVVSGGGPGGATDTGDVDFWVDDIELVS